VNEHKFRDKYYFYRFHDQEADDKSSTSHHRFRVVLLGDEDSGKSALFAAIHQKTNKTLRRSKRLFSGYQYLTSRFSFSLSHSLTHSLTHSFTHSLSLSLSLSLSF
jgi:hypothetical protein